MANDFDLDLSDDFNFDQEFNFMSDGKSFSEPPKNVREVVNKTLKDGKSGFVGSIKGDNASQLAKNIIEDSMPSHLSNEYDTIKSAYGEVSDSIKEELEGVKKESKKAVDAVSRLIPGNNKIHNILKKISSKLGEDEERIKKISKEEEQQNTINEAILATLGEQKTVAQQTEAVRQSMEEKRHISTTELLKNIYAELKLERNFQFEVANGYYRKSLEIQFKQLYTMQEQVGILKSGFETFKNQFEAIVKNTGLPEVVKIKQSEQLIKSIGDRYREELSNTFYKNIDPFRNMKERWLRNIKEFSNNLKEGLSGTADIADMMADMSDPEFGMSKGYAIGSFLGNAVRKSLVRKVTNKVYDTEKGRKATMAIKDMIQDPDGYLKSIAENEEGDTWLSKVRKNTARSLRNFTNFSSEQNRVVFDQDINAASVFDNRTKDSIVKVIPTLLSKIYSEIKSLRLKDKNPEQHELSYNFKKQEFQTREDMIGSIRDDMSHRVKNSIGSSMRSIEQILVEKGGMSKALVKEFKVNLIKYFYNHRSRINIDALTSKDFLSLFNQSHHKTIKNVIYRIKKAFLEDFYLQDDFNMSLRAIKAGLPNTNNIAKELISSGKLDIAKELGFVQHNSLTGTIVSDNGNMGNITSDLYGKLDSIYMQESVIDTITKNNDAMLKSKIEGFGSGFKSSFNSFKDKSKRWFDTSKKYYSENVDKYVKEYYNKANEYTKPYIDKMSKELSDNIEKLKETEAYKSADSKVKKMIESKAAKTLIEKYRKANTIIDNIDKKHNISKKAKWLQDLTKNKIIGLYNNNDGEREHLLNTLKDKIKYDQYGKPILDGLKDIKSDTFDFLNDKQSASSLFSKYKGKATDLIANTKELVTSEKAKEMYSNAINKSKDTIQKGKMTFKSIKDPDKRKELMLELKDDFIKSKKYAETKAENFKEYLEEIGFDLGSNPEEEIAEVLTTEGRDSIYVRLKRKLKLFKQKKIESQVDDLEEKLDTVTSTVEIIGEDKEEVEALKKEFFESPEYKSGDVTDFEQWCSALGYKLKKNKAIKTAKGFYKTAKAGYKFLNSDFFKKTRALDRKIFTSIPRVLGSIFKLGGKFSLKAGKVGFQTVSGTVGMLASIGLNTADSISTLLLGKVSNTLDAIASRDSKSKEKDVKERANSWKDRIKLFSKDKDGVSSSNKKRGFLKGVASFVKEHSSIRLGLGIAAIVGLLKTLNISMEDVKDFSSGIVTGIKAIGSTISNIWKFISSPIDTAKNIVSSAYGKIKNMLGFKGDTNDDNVSETTETSKGISGGEVAGMATVGLGAAYVGKKVYNVGKSIISPFYKTAKFAAQGATLATKAATTAITSQPTFLSKLKTLVMKSIEKISWTLPSSVVTTIKTKFLNSISTIKKLFPSWEHMKSGFNKLIKVAKRKSPKIATTSVTKLVTKLAAYFAAAAGVGLILTLGLVIWEIGWIMKYWLYDGVSFWSAVGKQLLGLDITDEDMNTTDDDIKAISKYVNSDSLVYEGRNVFSYRDENGNWVNIKEKEAIDRFGKYAVTSAISKWKESSKSSYSSYTINTQPVNNIKREIKDIVSKPVNNVSYSNTKTNVNNSKSNNIQRISNIPKATGSSSMKGSSQAALAASIASERAANQSTGKCAMRVRQALEAGGYQEPDGRPGSAYQYATTGFINKYGFERINVNPLTYQPQAGDVSITDRFNNHRHGHIAIYDGENWISDFRQKSISIYGDLPKNNAKDLISIWRDPGYGQPSSEASLNNLQDLTIEEENKLGNKKLTSIKKANYTPPTQKESTTSYSGKSTEAKRSNIEISNKAPSISMTETNQILSKQLEVQVKQLEVQMNMDKTLTQLLNQNNNFDANKLMPKDNNTIPTPAIGIKRNVAI